MANALSHLLKAADSSWWLQLFNKSVGEVMHSADDTHSHLIRYIRTFGLMITCRWIRGQQELWDIQTVLQTKGYYKANDHVHAPQHPAWCDMCPGIWRTDDDEYRCQQVANVAWVIPTIKILRAPFVCSVSVTRICMWHQVHHWLLVIDNRLFVTLLDEVDETPKSQIPENISLLRRRISLIRSQIELLSESYENSKRYVFIQRYRLMKSMVKELVTNCDTCWWGGRLLVGDSDTVVNVQQNFRHY